MHGRVVRILDKLEIMLAPAPTRAKIPAACRRLLAFVRDEGGGPLVEFTILIPIFFIILFGLAEWGNIFYYRNNMFNAARMAARAAAVGTIANTSAAAIAAACSGTGLPSFPLPPIKGSGYTYTFTYAYNTGCSTASNPAAPTWGTVTMTITSPAAAMSIFNYLDVIGATLSASATVQQEYTCPAAAATGAATSQTC